MKWLVSAFEPFGGSNTNASLNLAHELAQMDWQGNVQFYMPVPVEFGGAWYHLQRVIEASSDIQGVLALGEAVGRGAVSLECVALNWIDSRMPDNRGKLPARGPIKAGPEILWSDIPWEKFEPSGFSHRSYSAGTYVCNELMYRLLEWAKPRKMPAGFIHVPNDSSETLSEVRRALEFLVKI